LSINPHSHPLVPSLGLTPCKKLLSPEYFSKDGNISEGTSEMPAITTENLKSEKMQSPKFLAHFVLRTSYESYENMIEFYENFLSGTVIPSENIAFIRYDEEHQ
jgi:hypothetical protein